MRARGSRQKLIEAIVFFGNHTRFLGKAKLFKLLYLLDFEHFRERGRPVTGLDYSAWELGPVPEKLYHEWKDLRGDIRDAVSIERTLVPGRQFWMQKVIPKRDFDESLFTKREVKILSEIARKYRDTYAPALIDVTHAENGAWTKVWRNGQGANQRIPYELGIPEDNPHREFIIEASQRYQGQNRDER